MTPSWSADLARADDQLLLHFDFYNLQLANQELVRIAPDVLAYVVITFEPQNRAEMLLQADDTGLIQSDEDQSVSGVSGPTQLAFVVPDSIASIPYTVADLLAWHKWEPSVAATASTQAPELKPDPGVPDAPVTAIENPIALFLSPNEDARWAHSTDAVVPLGSPYNELWHTRLASKNADGTPAEPVDPSVPLPSLVAIEATDYPGGDLTDATPDVSTGKNGNTFRFASLNNLNRRDIVDLTANWAANRDGGYTPAPISTELLMLSLLGAWQRSHGSWDVPNVPLVEWTQHSAMGRDHYVRVVNRGWLFPTGHEAALVQVTNRRFVPNSVGDLRAVLVEQDFISIRKPIRDYGQRDQPDPYLAFGQAPNDARDLPFRRLEILTRITPAIDPNRDVFVHSPYTPPASQRLDAFWITANQTDVPFHVRATDWMGQLCEFTLPLVFVPEADIKFDRAVIAVPSVPPEMLISAYRVKTPPPRRTVDLKGQQVAFAASDPSSPGATSHPTSSVAFLARLGDLSVTENDLIAHDEPGFYPVMVDAMVRFPAAEQLAGLSPDTPLTLEYDQRYTADTGGFGPGNAISLYARIQPRPIPLNFPADKAGGVAVPNFGLGGVAQTRGLVAGTAGTLDQLQAGTFQPKPGSTDEPFKLVHR